MLLNPCSLLCRAILFYVHQLTVVFITVGKGECDDVAACGVDVEQHAVGRGSRFHLGLNTAHRRHFDVYLAKVFSKDHSQRVAVDGGLDGGGSRGIVGVRHFDDNVIGWVRGGLCKPNAPQCW